REHRLHRWHDRQVHGCDRIGPPRIRPGELTPSAPRTSASSSRRRGPPMGTTSLTSGPPARTLLVRALVDEDAGYCVVPTAEHRRRLGACSGGPGVEAATAIGVLGEQRGARADSI